MAPATKTPTITSSVRDVEQLEEMLSQPTAGVLETVSRTPGDYLVLGVGGKLGPSLARMLRRAIDATGGGRRVLGVSRFASSALPDQLRSVGVEPITCDLLDPAQLARLPDAPNLVYMAGMKFGSSGREALTWALNTYLPGQICQRFCRSRIVAFSTGNVYGVIPVDRGGSVESDPPRPEGEYAMSCLGRERIFEHFSRSMHIPLSIIRLNYACELRYGVLVDLAQRIWAVREIDLSMGSVNVMWQADAVAMSIRAFDHAASPPFVVNVAGPELLSVRSVCEQMGRLLERTPKFIRSESPDALLSDGRLGHRLLGPVRVTADQLIRWTADWLARGGATLGKPTHFEQRDGKF